MGHPRYVNLTFSKTQAKRIFASLPEETSQAIIQAHKGTWYPFEYQRQLRQSIIEHVDPSDPLGVTYKMGLVTASWDFSDFLKPFFSFISKKTVFMKSATLWRKYYDKGRMELKVFEDNHSSIELADFPCDENFHPIVTSWMMVALQTLKAGNPEVSHSREQSHTSSLHRFDLFWE
ncbi:hypothetical protein JXM67_13655 [candidate division WOR-3 bacterium]|nr:hypothetical protein [candidate division WOR-3 bacterium]